MLIKHLKHKKLFTLIKPFLFILALFVSLVLISACGNRKPPLPPTERVTQRVAIDGTQIGNQITIVWQMPPRNASDGSVLNIKRADIYRLAEKLDSPFSISEEEFATRSTLIASIPINETDFALKEKTFIDTLQFAGQSARLRYSIRFVNDAGQKAAFSNFLIIEPTSRVALNPENLNADVSQDQITLSWKAPESNVDNSKPANILGYNLYRKSAEETTRRLNETPINASIFLDTFFAFEKTYTYFVRTVSLGNNGEQVESLSSDEIVIKPVDTFPPSSPEAITIAASPNNISIFFAINPEKDVIGYKIFRTTNLNLPKIDWTLLNNEILRANTFQDPNVESGKTYYYYIKAVDKYGNESGSSEVVSETAF